MNLEIFLGALIARNLEPGSWQWLVAKIDLIKKETAGTQLNLTFTALSRKTGKKEDVVTAAEQAEADRLLPGFYIKDWTVDRLARVWLLMQPTSSDKQAYVKKIETLFAAAEMNEQVALYSALPVLAYPEEWRGRCAEGIRSNIGTVLEAIIERNPYPAAWLEEPAWNQLVMKAFFTDRDISKIIGLDRRNNANLARILTDYAQEREAAGRTVNPYIRQLAEKFN